MRTLGERVIDGAAHLVEARPCKRVLLDLCALMAAWALIGLANLLRSDR